jgi:hypothetical protein
LIDTLSLNKTAIADLTPLTGLTNLKLLDLRRCSNITDISFLNNFPYLSDLFVSGSNLLTTLLFPYPSNLKNLSLDELCRVTTVLLANTPLLSSLSVDNCDSLRSLTLPYTPNLESFYLRSRCDTLILGNAPKLQRLNLNNVDSLKVLSLSGCVSLISLDLSYEDIEFLSPFVLLYPSLEELMLSGNDKIKNLSFLAGLSTLNHLDISFCDSLTDISILDSLPNISYVDIENYNVKIADFSPLLSCLSIGDTVDASWKSPPDSIVALLRAQGVVIK